MYNCIKRWDLCESISFSRVCLLKMPRGLGVSPSQEDVTTDKLVMLQRKMSIGESSWFFCFLLHSGASLLQETAFWTQLLNKYLYCHFPVSTQGQVNRVCKCSCCIHLEATTLFTRSLTFQYLPIFLHLYPCELRTETCQL